jgi:hypothetical protein
VIEYLQWSKLIVPEVLSVQRTDSRGVSHEKSSFWKQAVLLWAVMVPFFASAGEIGFEVKQQGGTVTVAPNESVRPGDRLVVVDAAGSDTIIHAVVLDDANADGEVDTVKFSVPYRTEHRIDVSLVPIDAATAKAYCGFGETWHGSFTGTFKGKIRFQGPLEFADVPSCIKGYHEQPGLRLDGQSIIAGFDSVPSDQGVTTLSVFRCQPLSGDGFDGCEKHELASGSGSVLVRTDQVGSACSVLARTVYAEDRGRVIATEESAIRLNGFCLGNSTGIGFEAFDSAALAGLGTGSAMHGRSISTLSQSLINWVVSKVAKALGKKTAKEVDKALNQCDISLNLYQKIANVILDAATLGLLKACAAS